MSDVELIRVDSVTVVSRPKAPEPAPPAPAPDTPIPHAQPAPKPAKKKG